MVETSVRQGGSRVERPPHIPQERVVDFDIFAPPGLEEGSVHEAWVRLQQSTPYEVVWTPHNEGHWIALRGRTIRAMYRDFSHFSSHVIWIPKSEGENYGLVPTRLDPPEHTPFRQVLNRAIGITATKEMEPMVRAVAVRLIDQIAPRGECNFTEDYAKQFPVQVFLELLDLPVEDAVEVKEWVDQMTRPDGSMPMEEVMANFFRYVDPVIDQRLTDPGDDLISRVIHNDIDGRPMTRDELRGLVSLLLVAGLDTVVNVLGFFMEFLARNPAHRQQLVEDPKLTRKAVEELFRRFPVVAEARMVKVGTQVDGVELMAGEMVCVPTLLGGTDDRLNACPMSVDFNRKGISHITFGDGPHICAGQHFARLEAAITLEEWLKRIPDFEITGGGRVTHKSGIVCTVESLPLVWAGNAG